MVATGAAVESQPDGSVTLPAPPVTVMLSVAPKRRCTAKGAVCTQPAPSIVSALSLNHTCSMASTWWPASATTRV